MNWFRWRRRSFDVSECDPSYKVKYLGNVLTNIVRGEGCVDRPLTTIWNNYLANPTVCIDMQLTVTKSGLTGVTKPRNSNQPNQQKAATADCVTEYRCHRISYCLHHPQFPRLFVWVYRHDGRKMKVEARCHAVLCKSEAKAKAIYAQLRERMAFALAEYARDKTKRQNSRLAVQRIRSVPAGVGGIGLPVRTQHLRQGQHFKPLTSNSNNAPHLCVISEELDDEPDVGSGGGPPLHRLSWQGREVGKERAGVASGGAEQQRHPAAAAAAAGWSSAADDRRNSGDGDDDDDSVFMFKPPSSSDLRFSEDVFRSLSENELNGIKDADSPPPLRSDPHVCLLPPAVSPSSDVLHNSEGPAADFEALHVIVTYPSHPSPLFENDLTLDGGCRFSWERTEPEEERVETSKVSELDDDDSVESGFSEQDDGHDL